MQKTLCVIDLRAVQQNAKIVKNIIGDKTFYAVVKADAYGHGAEEVARALNGIVDGFCVAIVDEGIALRIAGVTSPILVFTPPLDGFDVARCAEYGLTVTVVNEESAKLSKGVDCQIKVNTGMNRLGCNICDLERVLKNLKKSNVVGVYSHLYAPSNDVASERQYLSFCRAERVVKSYFPNAKANLSASGGLLRGGKFLFDCVRSGILLYGYSPDGFECGGLTPAMKVYARGVQTTQFVGGGVGYSLADRGYSRLNTYRCGYADGFMRNVPLGEKTLCMDSFISERNEPLLCVMDDAERYAKRCGTISYEVLVNCSKRSERVYIR
jgi:alanine racemase